MFNKDLEKRVNELERQIMVEVEEDKEEKPFFNLYDIYAKSMFGYRKTLADKVSDHDKEISKLERRFDLLLKHFELEYHKITDENGTTKVKEVYKKAKKVKKSEKEDYDDED